MERLRGRTSRAGLGGIRTTRARLEEIGYQPMILTQAPPPPPIRCHQQKHRPEAPFRNAPGPAADPVGAVYELHYRSHTRTPSAATPTKAAQLPSPTLTHTGTIPKLTLTFPSAPFPTPHSTRPRKTPSPRNPAPHHPPSHLAAETVAPSGTPFHPRRP